MQDNMKKILLIVIAAVVVVGAYVFLTKSDDRNLLQRTGDAVESLDQGEDLDDAAREFESRTPAERMNDEIQDTMDLDDAGDDIEDSVDEMEQDIDDAADDNQL